ncbi:MAG: tetratricopeptide repeat protein, partial [Planctomycetota bacterium]|nr:tetratricopeptide repeat protein [Planctomycetota bacterium]
AAYWMAKCKLLDGAFAAAAKRFKKAIAEFGKSDLLPEMMYDRAVALIRGEERDEAIVALSEFRAKFGNHALSVDALQLLATATHQQGRYDESLTHCQALLKQDAPGSGAASISFLVGENEFLSGRLEKAIAAFRGFLSAHPDDGRTDQANYRIATALNRLGRYDEAAHIYGRLSKRATEDEGLRPVLLALGDIHFQRGEWKKAEASLAAYLSSGLEVASADEALLKLGLSKQRQERYEDALPDYGRLLSRFSKSTHRAHALFERGQALVALHRFDEAATTFEQLLAEAGDSRFAGYAVNHLGTMAMQTGNYEAAASRFERVAANAPEADVGAEAQFQRGQALMAAEKYKQAEQVFADFLKRHAKHDRAALAAGQTAIAIARQDRHAAAVEAVDRAIQHHGDKLGGDTLASLRYEKAWCLRYLEKPDEAAKVYREMLSARPEGNLALHARLEVAELDSNAKRYAPAIEMLTRLVERLTASSSDAPQDVREQAVYRLAVCRYETGQYDEAAKGFEAFVRAFPASGLVASASFHCGEALLRLERHKPAVEHFRRVVDKHASDPAYSASLLRLGECLAAVQSWPDSERAFSTYLGKFGGEEFWFQAQFGVGWARENQARHDDAIQAYKAVVARHNGPTAARAQFQMGECLFAKKQYKDAAIELLKVDILYAYPEWSAAALYEAGRCFEKLSQPVEARHRFREVTEKYRETQWASMAADRVAALSEGTVPGR